MLQRDSKLVSLPHGKLILIDPENVPGWEISFMNSREVCMTIHIANNNY